MALSTVQARRRLRIRIPRAFKAAEAAALLDLSLKALYNRLADGRLHGYYEVTRMRRPGMPFAYRWRRLYIAGTELERYMTELQAQRDATRLRSERWRLNYSTPEARRRYWRERQRAFRTRRARGEPARRSDHRRTVETYPPDVEAARATLKTAGDRTPPAGGQDG